MNIPSLGYRLRRSIAGDILEKTRTLDTARALFKALEYRLADGVLQVSILDQDLQYTTKSKEEYDSLRHLVVVERPVLTDFANELDPTDTVYDIGAHLGLYTVLAEQFITDGEIIAFELATPNAERLAEIASDSTEVVERAVSDESGKPYNSFNHQQSGVVSTSVDNSSGAASTNRTITIDEYATEHNIPNVVKMDVEGHEQAVLDGGVETLSNEQCRAVYVEVHEQEEQARITDQFHGLGFDKIEVLCVRDAGPQIHIKASCS